MGTDTVAAICRGPVVGTVGAVVVGVRLVDVVVGGVPGGGPFAGLFDDEHAARRDPATTSKAAWLESRRAIEVFGILPLWSVTPGVVGIARGDGRNVGGQDLRMAV
jgi:hypothetical protein